MVTRYLLDTNIVIYYTNDDLPENAAVLLDTEIEAGIYISVISEIELLGFNAPNPETLQTLQHFIDGSFIIELTRSINAKTIEIRKSKKIKLPDAVIAATAIVHDLTLISQNDRDFRKIDGLKYFNPFTDL